MKRLFCRQSRGYSLLKHDNLAGLHFASAFYRNVQKYMKEHPEIAYEIFGRKNGDVIGAEVFSGYTVK